MPVLATRRTAAGARAFARFFLQTVDWGYATTDSSYMRRYFVRSCETCRIVRLSLDNAKRDGKHYVGGRVTVVSAGPAKLGGEQRAERSVRLTVNISAIEVVDRGGKASSPEPAYVGYRETCGITWRDSMWQIVYLKASKS